MSKDFDIDLAREITGRMTAGRIVTRDGCPARIVCWDAKGDYPIIALVTISYAGEYPYRYTKDGKTDLRPNVRSTLDLLTERPRRWRVTVKRALQPKVTHELTCYLDLDGVREHFGLQNPGTQHYSIEEVKD